MPISAILISTRTKVSMVIGYSSVAGYAQTGSAHRAFPALHSSRGFTILEIILVLFLLVGLLGIILPRISLEENLGSVGRQMVGTVRSLQSLAMSTQKQSTYMWILKEGSTG